MADLKLGTTLGGAGIWSASNLPLLPSGGQLTYKGWRVYTENDRPTAEDINALSTINGGTVAKNTTFSQNVNVGQVLTANDILSNTRVQIARTGGAGANLTFRRYDVTGTPSSEIGIMDINVHNGSGQFVGAFNVNARPDGGNKIYFRAYKDGTQNTLLTIDSQTQQVTVEQGSFRVIGTSDLGVTNAASMAVSGAVTANTVTPANWANHDERYITGIPRGMYGTSFGAAVVTEKNDVLTVGGNITDGPYGNTTYYGQVVNYRRTLNTGVSLVQTYFGNEMWFRLGSGSPGAWSWNQGDANGWRRVYDTVTPPTPAEVGAVNKAGDTMSGVLTLASTGQPLKTQGGGIFANDGNVYINKSGFAGWIDALFLKNTGGTVTGTINQTGGYFDTSTEGRGSWASQNTAKAPIFQTINTTATSEYWPIVKQYYTQAGGAWSMGTLVNTNRFTVHYRTSSVDRQWYFDNSGEFVSSGEIITTSANGFRIAYGNTGSFIRSDGNNTYFLLTNSGDVYGGYNNLRPIYYSNTTGAVTMGHTLSVNGRISQSSSYIDDGQLLLNGSGSGRIYFIRSDANPRDMTIFHAGDASRGNRIELADTTSYLVYFERHPSSGIQMVMNGNGSFNDVYIRSDERLKSNFSKIENALDKVDLLDGMLYDKANHIGGEETTREAGLIAQQLQEVLPEAVKKGVDGEQNEILTVSSSAVIALLVNAVKELREEVRELKSR
ncbi:hypothetical protein ECF1_0061 [Enterobacter phage EC-F1]|nr:hypothetical protein ECF1_0061 [Enterobacter phage EC-F1]